ncbi:G patch domain-containing 4 [Pelobates cultripes]|uniref:G patch domain-containing protein 4 n=1 Tax=Pelobates cultripes TaxID=61616 RepID=A0AAD1WWQ5_PELCU|nr:G patch domain-containing 4 [Pelobates cultripes]
MAALWAPVTALCSEPPDRIHFYKYIESRDGTLEFQSKLYVLHQFPNSAERIKAWLQASGDHFDNIDAVVQYIMQHRTKSYFHICSDHFETEMFVSGTRTRLYLKSNAVPTIFPRPSVLSIVNELAHISEESNPDVEMDGLVDTSIQSDTDSTLFGFDHDYLADFSYRIPKPENFHSVHTNTDIIQKSNRGTSTSHFLGRKNASAQTINIISKKHVSTSTWNLVKCKDAYTWIDVSDEAIDPLAKNSIINDFSQAPPPKKCSKAKSQRKKLPKPETLATEEMDVAFLPAIQPRTVARDPTCKELVPWTNAIVNHFWASCYLGKGNPDLLRERWVSVLHHITNVHEWESENGVKRCSHKEMSESENQERTNPPSIITSVSPSNIDFFGHIKSRLQTSEFGNTSLYNPTCKMSTPSAPKSQGMRFAEEQLQRHGWTEGKGLGKRESGISEAIKVKVKCDKAGVGHDSAEQFTFHWWDHVFNKTAASISVEADHDQGGVQVKKLKEEESIVTNKKPRKAFANSNMLYGRFVKSATLLSGGEKPVEKSSSSESSDSEDEDEKLDLSSTTKMTDEDLIKVCGGRTAHKGARHGLTMSAKLSRLEEQERAFLEKYGRKGQKTIEAPAEDNAGSSKKRNKKHSQEQANDTISISSEPALPKKKKRKNTREHGGLKGHDDEVEPCADQDGNGTKRNEKRKKSHRKESPSPEELAEQDEETMDSHVKSKKKKKKQKKYAE